MHQRVEDTQVRVEEPVLDRVGDLVPRTHGHVALHLDVNVDPKRQAALPYAEQVDSIHAGHRFHQLPDSPDDPIHLSEILIGDRVPSWLNPTWPVSKGGMKSANERGMHLIRRGDGEEELYDLRHDRSEERNLIDEAEHAAVAARLRAWLDRIW